MTIEELLHALTVLAAKLDDTTSDGDEYSEGLAEGQRWAAADIRDLIRQASEPSAQVPDGCN